jgi:hypothetical protein
MNRFMLCTATVLTITFSTPLHARPDGRAPIGVMGDHVHHEGGWMVSYRYEKMGMESYLNGTERRNWREIHQIYPTNAVSMEMEMHMAEVMYSPTEDLSLMLMAPYTINRMVHHGHHGGMHGNAEMETEGLGDVSLTALTPLWQSGSHKLLLNAGISAPTGSIKEKMDGEIAHYDMQLGSGSWDVLPGITYTGSSGDWSWGSQLAAVIRLHENSRDYRLGNRLTLSGWGARRLNDYTSVSLRLDGQEWGNIHGRDTALDATESPSNDPDAQGGRRVDLLAGLNFFLPEWDGQRFAIEAGRPIYQKLEGPQMAADYRLTAGWQYAF